MNIADLPTPALVIDEAVVRRNIEKLQAYAGRHGLAVRPHTKTHKSRRFAAMQIGAGAAGLTVAKVGEAEVMHEECNDLLIAFPAVDPSRVRRIAELAKRVTIHVAVDSIEAVQALSASAIQSGTNIGILVDIDVGMGRTGVETPERALQLARQIERSAGTRLDGIMCYPGHIWSPVDRQTAELTSVSAKLEETLELWKRSGLSAGIVSGGSTPTAYQSHLVPQYTEIRPGTYLFNDVNEWRGGYAELGDCAAKIVATVVSNAVAGQAVLDCGTKTLTSDLCAPAKESGHGFIVEYPAAKITRLSEEHAQVDVSRSPTKPRIGERVSIVPNHICPCINLQDEVWLIAGDGSLQSLGVEGRGKLS